MKFILHKAKYYINLRSYFFSNSPVICLFTKVVFPIRVKKIGIFNYIFKYYK